MKMYIIVFETTKKEEEEAVNPNNMFFLPPMKSLCGITQFLLGCLLWDVGSRLRAIMQ